MNTIQGAYPRGKQLKGRLRPYSQKYLNRLANLTSEKQSSLICVFVSDEDKEFLTLSTNSNAFKTFFFVYDILLE
jgi:hypothetical protein